MPLLLVGQIFFLSRYDKHQCYAPREPYTEADKYEWDTFKMEVERYSMCIKEYIDNAQKDIERIRIESDNAIEEHNRFINSL